MKKILIVIFCFYPIYSQACRFIEQLPTWPDRNISELILDLQRCPVREFIPMTPGNIGYSSAMELFSGEFGWNVNVVGRVAQNSAGEIINDYGNGTDVIEAVFKITLTEPTTLLIGVRAAIASVDLDLFVVNEMRPNGNFFDVDEQFDMSIDFAATAYGYEDMAREYPPGVYYILVTLFDGDGVPTTDFGLLVTENPVYLNCFNNQEDVDRHLATPWTTPQDSNGEADWEHFKWDDVKYGSSLSQIPAQGGKEDSGYGLPFLSIPSNGFTVIDFDSSVLITKPTTRGGSTLKLQLEYAVQPGVAEDIWSLEWNPGVNGDPIDVNGTEMGFLMWQRYIGLIFALTGNTTDFTLEPGFSISPIVLCGNTGQRYLLDNFRVYNVAVSLDPVVRANEPANLIFGSQKPKFKKMK